jgi:hypothetical protein
MFVVTVKLPKNPNHNPHDKKSGECPASGGPCTDVTGEHHSYLDLAADSIDMAMGNAHLRGFHHVTRVEQVVL